MASKKRPNNKTSNYLISMGEGDLTRDGANYLGKLRSNFVGTEFQVRRSLHLFCSHFDSVTTLPYSSVAGMISHPQKNFLNHIYLIDSFQIFDSGSNPKESEMDEPSPTRGEENSEEVPAYYALFIILHFETFWLRRWVCQEGSWCSDVRSECSRIEGSS